MSLRHDRGRFLTDRLLDSRVPGTWISVGRPVFVVVVILAAVLLLTRLHTPEGEKRCTMSPDLRMTCVERAP